MFKPQQVLRTTQSLRTGTSPRQTVSKGARVVVVNVKDGLVTVRPQAKAGEPATELRVTAKPAMFEVQRRGRPSKVEAEA